MCGNRIAHLNIFPLASIHPSELASNQPWIAGLQALGDPAIGGLDKAVGVYLCIGCQVADQADIGTFRRLNWTDAPIVRFMHVTHIEASTLTRETTRTQGRE